MDRMGCVDLAAFPLQLLLRKRPDFRGKPVAVVEEDKPQAFLLWVNEAARRTGIVPGQRYAAALSLCHQLCAGTISESQIEEGLAFVTERLRAFSPEIEASREAPGVFWLNAGGLGRLFPSHAQWAHTLRQDLQSVGLEATVIVGFTRFGTFAAARSRRGILVFPDPPSEREAALGVPLARLELDPEVRDDLQKLGIHEVGELLSLPSGDFFHKFGDEAHRFYEMARGLRWSPFLPETPTEPYERVFEIDPPELDVERLLFQMKPHLDLLLRRMKKEGRALYELLLRLELDATTRPRTLEESLRPAAPTFDTAQLLGLVRLRLESSKLGGGVCGLRLLARGVKFTPEQLSLFDQRPQRDLDACHRAFARLRAEFGESAVVRAKLEEAHLPLHRFSWEPIRKARRPQPREVAARRLIRRVYEKPIALPPRSRHEPDGWLLRGLEHGPVLEFLGPYVLSGGWWGGSLVEREYYFAKMQQGEVLWIYYDRRRRRWFLEGRLE